MHFTPPEPSEPDAESASPANGSPTAGLRILLIHGERFDAALRGSGFEVLLVDDPVDERSIDLAVIHAPAFEATTHQCIESLHRHRSVPVLVLGAQVDDDFLVQAPPGPGSRRRPVSLELVERVRHRARRRRDVYRSGPLTLDLGRRTVHIGGEPVPLAPREFDLLAYLASRADRAVPREELLRNVWNADPGDTATVTEHVRRIRNKVEQVPEAPRCIETVRNLGYRFAFSDSNEVNAATPLLPDVGA